MNRKFVKTVFISSPSELRGIKPGQWIMFDSGQRGQFLGISSHGTIVIRYKNEKFGKRKDTESNKLLRRYAVINGSR